MATGVKPLNDGIQNWLLKQLERLINEFPGFPTLFSLSFAYSDLHQRIHRAYAVPSV